MCVPLFVSNRWMFVSNRWMFVSTHRRVFVSKTDGCSSPTGGDERRRTCSFVYTQVGVFISTQVGVFVSTQVGVFVSRWIFKFKLLVGERGAKPLKGGGEAPKPSAGSRKRGL